MLVKHLRVNHKPFGTIVAIAEHKVGVSLCSPKDRFNKKLGTLIAQKRAEANACVSIPNRVLDGKSSIESVVASERIKMVDRARKYFK